MAQIDPKLMEKLAEIEIPEYVLTLAQIAWERHFPGRSFVVTSLEGFRGLCKTRQRWVQNICLDRNVAHNFHMLCPDKFDREASIAAYSAWPASDSNTYAVFDPKDLPNAFPSIPPPEASRTQVAPGSSPTLTQGS